MFSFESVIHNLKETIILFDRKSRVTFINKSGEELLGKGSRDIVGNKLSRLFVGEKKLSLLIRKSIKEERSFRGKSVSIFMGRQMNIDFSLCPLYVQDRVEGASLSLSENIPLAEGGDNDQEALAFLLGSIAHEIKNPLGGIKGAAQLLRKKTEDSALTEFADLIVRETDRLNMILQDYLTICRTPSFEAVNIHKVLEKAVAILSAPIEKAGISIRRLYDPSLPDIIGDESKLLQVFLNIIKNAVEAMKRGGMIEISTSPSRELFGDQGKIKRMALISIRDTGKGISEEDLQKVFLPFYTKKKGGTGIGLSLSKKIMKDHGGRISVASQKGRGTAFSLYLPFREK